MSILRVERDPTGGVVLAAGDRVRTTRQAIDGDCDVGGDLTVVGALAGASMAISGVEPVQFVDVSISSAELLALNTTPKEIVPAPGVGLTIVPQGPIVAILTLDFATTAYDGIAAGEDLSFKYDDETGTELYQVEATGFLDDTADQTVIVPQAALTTPEEDVPVVLHMLTGNIATGDSPLLVRFYYRIMPFALA